MTISYQHSLIALISTAALACSQGDYEMGIAGGSGSDLSTVTVGVPETSRFGENGNKLTGYHLVVEAAPNNTCEKPTKIDKALAYSDLKMEETLNNGCLYHLKLSLGHLEGGKLAAIFYETKVAATIDTTKAKAGEKVTANPILNLTDAGREAGLPERPAAATPGQNSDQQPNAQTEPAAPEVAEKFNMTLKSASGDVNLKEQIKAEYIFLKFSADYCGPCVSMLNSIEDSLRAEANKVALANINNGKCQKLTIITGSLQLWSAKVSASAMKSSYTVTGAPPPNGEKPITLGTAGTKLIGQQVTSTPTPALVKRDGTVVEVGPKAFQQFLQQCNNMQ